MNELELKEIWQSYDRKLEKSLAINYHLFETIKIQKAKSKLNALIIPKLIMIALGILWMLFLGALVYAALRVSNTFFGLSAGMIILINGIAVMTYVRQLFLIRQVNRAESVVDVQHRLSQLQSSTMLMTRMLFLQLPFYTTWYINSGMIANGNTALWILQIAVTMAFTLLAVWLFRNITYKNAGRKWFKILFDGSGWKTVNRSMEFMHEVEEFKKEED